MWNVATVVKELGSAAEHLDIDTITIGHLVITSDVRICLSKLILMRIVI